MLHGNDVEVDDGDYHQRTALHLAASAGQVAMVRHLVLLHGASMACTDRYAGTPIMDAVRHKHSGVVAFLRRHGARLNFDKAKGARPPAPLLPHVSSFPIFFACLLVVPL